MTVSDPTQITRDLLLDFFLESAKPREEWRVGMEVEKMGRHASTGLPIPFRGASPSVLEVLELILSRRGGDPVWEATHLIGVEGPWGSITLEPGGQVEWSSRPRKSLDDLRTDLVDHLAMMDHAAQALGLRWLEVGVDPETSLAEMPWMPKARYSIMRPYLGERGGLAQRMMTQTASIQAAFDYSDPQDWREKFKTAALLTPISVALFANSTHIDGSDTGYRDYRQVIWRATDPDRCGLPRRVFEPGFDLESWLDYALEVPSLFRHRARGLVPTGGVPFRHLLELGGCDAIKMEDWETHLSTIFTEVRSYGYIEVRSADLQPGEHAFEVPTFWTGLLYDDGARDQAQRLCAGLDDYSTWTEALESAARLGTEGTAAGRSVAEMARDALSLSRRALAAGCPCAGEGSAATGALDALAERRGLGALD